MNDFGLHVVPPFVDVTIAIRASQLDVVQTPVAALSGALRSAHMTWIRLLPSASTEIAAVGKSLVRKLPTVAPWSIGAMKVTTFGLAHFVPPSVDLLK